MPRARIPDASFIASTEHPILPFLAPRVYAESPILRRKRARDGKRTSTQKEEAKEDYEHGLGDSLGESSNHQRHYYRRLEQQNPAGGLLGRPGSLLKLSSNDLVLKPLDHCYANIFAFARIHSRSYNTAPTGTVRFAPKTRRVTQRTTVLDTVRIPSALKQRGHVLASRRDKALALEQQRLDNYVFREPGLNATNAFRSGRYRSLARRIHNLRYWNSTHIDLGTIEGDLNHEAVFIQAFAALDRRVYKSAGKHTHRINIKHHPRCARWSAQLFRNTAKHELHGAWSNWMEFDIGTRKKAYLNLLLYLLDRKPGRALQFLQVLANDPLLRGMRNEAIADGLGYLSRLHIRGTYAQNEDWSHDPAVDRRKFVPTFVHIYHQALGGNRHLCSQDLLYSIVDLADIEDLKKVFDCLVEQRTRLGFDTLLHYANAFARAGEFQCALRCLEELKAMSGSSWDAVALRERLRWTCALILRKSMSKSAKYHETPGIVAAIVRLGIKMDILLYNVVMHNAMEASDYATAFKVYNTLESNGLEADSHTFSILLHGCAMQNNPTMFTHFAEHCAEVARDTKDRWLATDYLYYLYVRHQDHTDKQRNWNMLLQAYLRFFSAIPLGLISNRAKKTMVSSPDDNFSLHSVELEPPPIAIYIMLQAQIQSALAASPRKVSVLYQKIRLLVKENAHPSLNTLAQDPIMWNAFLLAFCQKQQFASASQLLEDMTNDSPQPNVYSWNIFMQAFFKKGQIQAAERVFDIIRNRGIDPDQFTYGVLLRGYAKAQHIDRIGEIMQHLDTEQEMDPGLLRALSQVLNRNKLMLTLEKSRIYKETKAHEESQEKAGEIEARWEAPRYTSYVSERLQSDYSDASDELGSRSIASKQSAPKNKEQMHIEGATSAQHLSEQRSAHASTRVQQGLDDRFDPEVAYRRLQKDLGVVTPSRRSYSSSHDNDPESQMGSANSFGAYSGFETMPAHDDAKSDMSTSLPKFKAEKVFRSLNQIKKQQDD